MKWFWYVAISGYVVPAIVMAVYLVSNDLNRPVIGSLLWPIRLIKLLLGGG
jgi:hypothetical protein